MRDLRKGILALPRHLVSVQPGIDDHRLEPPHAIRFLDTEIVPVADAKDEVRAVIYVVLQNGEKGFDLHSLALPLHEEVIGQMLACIPPTRTIVPEFPYRAPDGVAAVHFALPQVVERSVLGETVH